MITESSEVVEVVRAPSAKQMRTKQTRPSGVAKGLHMKGFILQQLAKAGEDGLWDHEIMQLVFDEFDRSGTYWKGEIRATLTDLFSGALVLEVEDDLDDGRYFGSGKILMKFRLSPFGTARMSETGLT